MGTAGQTFRWQAGCQCCQGGTPAECHIYNTLFDVYETGAWEELRGEWIHDFASSSMTTQDSNALLLNVNESPVNGEYLQVKFIVSDATKPCTATLQIKTTDNDASRMIAKITWGGDNDSITLINAEGESKTKTYDQGDFSDFLTAGICWYDGVLTLGVSSVSDCLRIVAPDNGGKRAGIGTGSLSGGTMRFDSFSYEIHKQPGYENCNKCDCISGCYYCNPDTTPLALKLTISGLSNGDDCENCDSFNGEYFVYLSYEGSPSHSCEWETSIPNPSGCPEEDPQTTLTIIAYFDDAGTTDGHFVCNMSVTPEGGEGGYLVGRWESVITDHLPADCNIVFDGKSLDPDMDVQPLVICSIEGSTCTVEVVSSNEMETVSDRYAICKDCDAFIPPMRCKEIDLGCSRTFRRALHDEKQQCPRGKWENRLN